MTELHAHSSISIDPRAPQGASIKTYIGHGQEVHDVAIASDNSRLASCGGDKLVHYWDVSTGQVLPNPETFHSNPYS